MHYIKVNARYCLRIFANSSPVTCSNELSLISLLITRSGNTINTRQNRVKVSNLVSLLQENLSLPKIRENKDRWRTFEGETVSWETRNISIYLILKNLCQSQIYDFHIFLTIKKSGTNMCSYLCRGNGSHIWLFYDLASSIRHGNVSKKATKTEKLPRKTWKLR